MENYRIRNWFRVVNVDRENEKDEADLGSNRTGGNFDLAFSIFNFLFSILHFQFFIVVRVFLGQVNLKCCARAWGAFHFDRPAVSLDDAIADRQSETQAASFVRRNEGLEDFSNHPRLDTEAGVCDRKDNAP